MAALARPAGDGFHFAAALYSEDGRDAIVDEAHFPAVDLDAAAALGRAMLRRAPDSIRRLFE